MKDKLDELHYIYKMIGNYGFCTVQELLDKYIEQKEFIKYMNDIIEDLETEDVDDEEMKGYLIQRIDTFKEILQKYKDIIGDDK